MGVLAADPTVAPYSAFARHAEECEQCEQVRQHIGRGPTHGRVPDLFARWWESACLTGRDLLRQWNDACVDRLGGQLDLMRRKGG